MAALKLTLASTVNELLVSTNKSENGSLVAKLGETFSIDRSQNKSSPLPSKGNPAGKIANCFHRTRIFSDGLGLLLLLLLLIINSDLAAALLPFSPQEYSISGRLAQFFGWGFFQTLQAHFFPPLANKLFLWLHNSEMLSTQLSMET